MRQSVVCKDGKFVIKNQSPENSPKIARTSYFQAAESGEFEDLEYRSHVNQKFTELIQDCDFKVDEEINLNSQPIANARNFNSTLQSRQLSISIPEE